MADDARRPGDDLMSAPPPDAMSFFELLRRLEGEGQHFGRAGGASREPARLGQSARMAVATRDFARVVPRGQGRPPAVEVEVIGLLGPEGPMPLHLTRWVFDRVSQRWFEAGNEHATSDTTALDFCNMLQHRMVALYWRAWADARLFVHAERPRAGRVGATLSALAGIGLPGLRPKSGPLAETETIKLDHATRAAHEVQGRERLTAPLADLLGAPVRLREFVAGWIDIPVPLQSQLGQAHVRLGQGAVVGARAFSRQDRAELQVGPVDLRSYLRLIEDQPLRERLRHLVLHLVGREVDIDLRPILARDEVPEPRLGKIVLGRTTWLAVQRSSDRSDLRMSRVTREAA